MRTDDLVLSIHYTASIRPVFRSVESTSLENNISTGHPTDSAHKAYLFLIITTLCFGMNANFSRLAVGEVSPMLLVCLRWLGTVALLVVVSGAEIRRDWPAVRPHLVFLLLMGMLGLATFNALFYVAAHTTTAINIGIIQGSIPMFVLIGAFVVYRSQARWAQIAGIVVTLLGVVIVTAAGDWQRIAALEFKRGDLLMIIACLLYSGYAVGLRRCPSVSPLTLSAMFAAGALVVSIPLAGIEQVLGAAQWPTPRGWIIVGLIILFPSYLAQLFFIKGVAIIGAGRAGIFFNLVPIFAALFAVIFLAERFELYHGAALTLVLGGIALSEWRKSG